MNCIPALFSTTVSGHFLITKKISVSQNETEILIVTDCTNESKEDKATDQFCEKRHKLISVHIFPTVF